MEEYTTIPPTDSETTHDGQLIMFDHDPVVVEVHTQEEPRTTETEKSLSKHTQLTLGRMASEIPIEMV